MRSKLPWFKIREAYPASGEARRHTRRDLRGGGALGRAAVTPDGVRLVSHWGEPFAGCERAVYSLSPDGATFTADATITMAGAAAGAVVRYRTIYRKA